MQISTQIDIALLGVKIGAIVGAIATLIGVLINVHNSKKLAKQVSRTDYIKSQIKDLYGPLVYFTELNEKLWDRHQKILAAYGEYFDEIKAIDPDSRQQSKAVMDKCNLYGQQIVNNNQSVVAVLRNNLGLLDPDDTELFWQYITDTTIYDLESDQGQTMPAEFYIPEFGLKNCLGPKFIRRNGFAKQIRDRLIAKQNELRGLNYK